MDRCNSGRVGLLRRPGTCHSRPEVRCYWFITVGRHAYWRVGSFQTRRVAKRLEFAGAQSSLRAAWAYARVSTACYPGQRRTGPATPESHRPNGGTTGSWSTDAANWTAVLGPKLVSGGRSSTVARPARANQGFPGISPGLFFARQAQELSLRCVRSEAASRWLGGVGGDWIFAGGRQRTTPGGRLSFHCRGRAARRPPVCARRTGRRMGRPAKRG